MKLPGSTLLKVSGIVLVVFAGIGVILGALAFGGLALLSAMGAPTGLLTVLMIFAVLSALFSLYVGVMAIMGANKKEKAGQLFLLGVISVALVALDLIFSLIWLGPMVTAMTWVGALFSLVLPILIIVGAKKNQEAA